MPQGLIPLPNLLPSLPPKLLNLVPKASKCAAKPAAKVAAKLAAKPAAGEPILVAPVEHVQLFKVKYLRQKKWHTQPVARSGGGGVVLFLLPAVHVLCTSDIFSAIKET